MFHKDLFKSRTNGGLKYLIHLDHMILEYVVVMLVIRIKQMDNQQHSSLKCQINVMVKEF